MKYLITGVTGTLGQAVLKLALENPGNEVIGVSRDEQKQRLIPPHPRLKLALGDIRDRDRMVELTRGVDVIFHFAALKCVDSIEENPLEAFKTNTMGTSNLVYAQLINDVPRLVMSSTDKAAFPINAYGNSKAMAEKLVLAVNNNIVCRYGNVIASRGSVIPAFVKSLKESSSVNVTDSKMTRFFIQIKDAAKFVFESSKSVEPGLKIPEMKATTVLDVAESVADIMGIKKFNINFIGMRAGEKIHECLKMPHEGDEVYSNTSDNFSRSELKELLLETVTGAM